MRHLSFIFTFVLFARMSGNMSLTCTQFPSPYFLTPTLTAFVSFSVHRTLFFFGGVFSSGVGCSKDSSGSGVARTGRFACGFCLPAVPSASDAAGVPAALVSKYFSISLSSESPFFSDSGPGSDTSSSLSSSSSSLPTKLALSSLFLFSTSFSALFSSPLSSPLSSPSLWPPSSSSLFCTAAFFIDLSSSISFSTSSSDGNSKVFSVPKPPYSAP
mmetsp:Transcript_19866/g.29306  ORF Transcript_19866/g.29306 Transcript_19866/m.29306 type:complete len:215 (-) Transcript_19866:632-1276(-)